MKKIVVSVVLALVAALSMSAQNGEMYYKAGKLYMDGQVIEPAQLEALVGPDIYSETCVGALKQCRVAKTLSIVGLSTAGVGLVTFVGGVVGLATSDVIMDDGAYAVAQLGLLSMVVGATCIDVAIPFGLFGKNRLKWVAEDYNQKNSPTATLNFGMQKNGFGLALNF